MTTELLPCPGCKDMPHLDNKQNIAFWVECGCGWAGPRRGNVNHAIELWNTRARPAPSADAVALAKELSKLYFWPNKKSTRVKSNDDAEKEIAALLEAFRQQIWAEAIVAGRREGLHDAMAIISDSKWSTVEPSVMKMLQRQIDKIRALTPLERKE